MSGLGACRVLSHPLLNLHFARLRSVESDPQAFRESLNHIAMHLALAVCEDLPTEEISIETPLEEMRLEVAQKRLLAISILRAGNGLLDPFLSYVPFAKAGHIGLERAADGNSVSEYYFKIPKNCEDYPTVVLDPMLATGGSASDAIRRLKAEGIKTISFAAVVACPEGVARLHADHPDVKILAAAMDRELNEKKYILPGLGDAGDRIYGTL